MTTLEERWVWLIGSIILGVFASWMYWLFLTPHEKATSWSIQWQRWPGHEWVEQGMRLLYALGIPAAALLWRGALTERGLGLQPLLLLSETADIAAQRANWRDWLLDISWTLGIALATGLIFGLGAYQQRNQHQRNGSVRHDVGRSVREAVYHESHWAFYREPFVLLWGRAIGSWAGLLPALIEMLLNPQRWDELHTHDRGRDLLLRGALAVMSALIFLQTQNSWCALGADIVLGYALGSAQSVQDAVAQG